MIQALILIFAVLLDRVSKWVVAAFLAPDKTQVVIPGVLNLTYVENKGAAFGMLQNQQWLFILVTCVVIIGIGYVLIKQPPKHVSGRIGLPLLMAGAIGNLIDRIFVGYVVDFIDFHIIQFYVFNVADICVTISAFLVGYYLLFAMDKEKLDAASPKEEVDLEDPST